VVSGFSPSSHSGIVLKFGELLIKEGSFPRDLGRELNRARYDPHVGVTEEDGERILGLADELIEALRKHLGKA